VGPRIGLELTLRPLTLTQILSQKLTWPGATGELPALTVAVSVTKAPDVTVVTGVPAEETDNVVVVAAGAAQAG
jgi:hypothetical protein